MAEERKLAVIGDMDVVVVTPKGEVAHRAAREVTAFGSLGEFGVLPGHIPFLTLLGAGVLILDGAAGREVWAHGPGVLEVGAGGKVEVLVEQAAAATKIDTAEATAELQLVEQEVKDFTSADGAEWRSLNARREWALARIEARSRA